MPDYQFIDSEKNLLYGYPLKFFQQAKKKLRKWNFTIRNGSKSRRMAMRKVIWIKVSEIQLQ